jgi:hypothetical protein
MLALTRSSALGSIDAELPAQSYRQSKAMDRTMAPVPRHAVISDSLLHLQNLQNLQNLIPELTPELTD